MSRYGCYDRPPLAPTVVVQAGWMPGVSAHEPHWPTREPVMLQIEDPMSKECQYSLTAADPRCQGCKNNRAEQLNEGATS